MSSTSSAILRPSWDIPGSTFKTLELLQNLIRVSSQDDVHPQAVLSAETVGAGFLVAPGRFSEAIDSLGGNDSIKLESIKAIIGLTSGGTQRAMCLSSPLLRFYIFCTACKLVFTDNEIADLIFEIMTAIGLLSKHPVAPAQIGRLINQLAGHAEQIVPIQDMHDIAVSLARHNPMPDVYMRMDLKALAQLFMHVFENLRDESVESMKLKGHDNSVWISTALTWMLGDDACLLVDSELVIGKPDARMTITIEAQSSEPWTLDVWKHAPGVVSYVSEFKFEFNKDEHHALSRLPLNNLCSFFDSYYWSAYHEESQLEIRRGCKRVAGEIAAALILLLAEDSRLIMRRSCCNKVEDEDPCSQVNLLKIASRRWVSEYSELLKDYGWSAFQAQTALHARMKAHLVTIEDHTGTGFTDFTVLEHDAHWIRGSLKEFCDNYIHEQLGEDIEADYVRDPAMYVATDAVLTATTVIKSGRRYIRPLDLESIDRSENIITTLLSTGMEVSEFRTNSLQQVLPGLEIFQPSSLILSSNGYVAGMSILWNPTASQRESLAITVLLGQIKKDNLTYAGIRETKFTSTQLFDLKSCPSLELTKAPPGSRKGLSLKSPLPSPAVRFESSVSVSGNWLELKQYMVHQRPSFTGQHFKCKASWLEAIDMLATSTHLMDCAYLMPSAELELGKVVQKKLIEEGVRWAAPVGRFDIDGDACIIVDCAGDEMVKIFATGHCGKEAIFSRCRAVVVRHRGNILQSIQQAEEESAWWVLIS